MSFECGDELGHCVPVLAWLDSYSRRDDSVRNRAHRAFEPQESFHHVDTPLPSASPAAR